jgi:hypothetical protein
MELPPFDQMHTEHAAWTDGVVHEFRALGIDINQEKYDALARAIELWGEELAALRLASPEPHERALMEKRANYAIYTARRDKAPSA